MKRPISPSPPPDSGSGPGAERFTSGYQAEKSGRLDEARRAYVEGLSLESGRHAWRYRLGCVHLKQDCPAAAEEEFREALSGDPAHASYWANLGVALDRQGRRDEAVRAYRKAARQPGGSPVANHNLGAIYAEEGRTAEAIIAFREAIALAPDAEGYQNLGLVHFAAEDFDAALSCFERCADYDSEFALGHYYGALCVMRRGLYRDALARFEQAWRLDPRLARIPYYLGTCLHKLERYPEARLSLERALEFFPEDGRLHYQLALTCDAMGLPQEARLHYTRARAARQGGSTC